jgi:hypothetical protein
MKVVDRVHSVVSALLVVSAAAASVLMSDSASAAEKVQSRSYSSCIWYDGYEKRIQNKCGDKLEVYWRDNSGWNQWTISGNSYYPYTGNWTVLEAYACEVGESFDRVTHACYHWDY